MGPAAERSAPDLSAAKRRLLERLKLRGAATVSRLAAALELTDVAVRQHLVVLEELGLVSQEAQEADGPGRPAALWRLTGRAEPLFPDRHGELTVGLIEALRRTFGEDGLERLVAARADDQSREYAQRLPPASAPLGERVRALADRRSREGYMAEVRVEAPGRFLLVEHHCPICDAARACTGLCSAELDVFRRALGPDASVERTEHLLSGGERCVYRIEGRCSEGAGQEEDAEGGWVSR